MEANLGATVLTATPDGSSGADSVVEAPYGAAVDSDAALFADRLRTAEGAAGHVGPVAEALLDPLDRMNLRAKDLVAFAETALESGEEWSPSEIIRLTAQSQEFMFHAQLTANVANRTSDGLQQLFRQQS